MSKNALIGKKSIFDSNPIEWLNKYTKKEVDDNPTEMGGMSEPKKMTAYELADACEKMLIIDRKQVATMLREQADFIMELEKQLAWTGDLLVTGTKVKQLSDDEIHKIWMNCDCFPGDIVGFSRALIREITE